MNDKELAKRIADKIFNFALEIYMISPKEYKDYFIKNYSKIIDDIAAAFQFGNIDNVCE